MLNFRVYITRDEWQDVEGICYDTDNHNNLMILRDRGDGETTAHMTFKSWLFIFILDE